MVVLLYENRMPVQLINPNGPFPGCDHEGKRCAFWFSDPHTGMEFDNPGFDLYQQAKLVAEHRAGNPSIYSPDQPGHFDLEIIRQEIIVQTCSRHPELCEDSALSKMPQPIAPNAPPARPNQFPKPGGGKCPKCQGSNFEPVLCHSCGGGKVSGYRCTSCGFQS